MKGIQMIRLLCLLVALSLASPILAADPTTCAEVSPSYKAPYDLFGRTNHLLSINFAYYIYYINPCSVMSNPAYCMHSSNQQQCIQAPLPGELTIDLGTPRHTNWSAVDPNDWSKGIISINTDFAPAPSLCTPHFGTHFFKVTWKCVYGDDRMHLVSEPQGDRSTDCYFEFWIDSAIICNYQPPSNTSSSSSTAVSPSSSSSRPAAPSKCSDVSSSYPAPFDLFKTPRTLAATSPAFPGGQYYIQPCGAVPLSLCPYSVNAQQCFAMRTWELISDSLGTASLTNWMAVDPLDWTQGIISLNYDITEDFDQCDASIGSNQFKTTYKCIRGDDSLTIISEPTADKSGPCVFEMLVDSSVICVFIGKNSTGGPSSSSSSSSTASASTGGSTGGSRDSDSSSTLSLSVVLAVTSVLGVLAGVFAGALTVWFVLHRKANNPTDPTVQPLQMFTPSQPVVIDEENSLGARLL